MAAYDHFFRVVASVNFRIWLTPFARNFRSVFARLRNVHWWNKPGHYEISQSFQSCDLPTKDILSRKTPNLQAPTGQKKLRFCVRMTFCQVFLSRDSLSIIFERVITLGVSQTSLREERKTLSGRNQLTFSGWVK